MGCKMGRSKTAAFLSVSLPFVVWYYVFVNHFGLLCAWRCYTNEFVLFKNEAVESQTWFDLTNRSPNLFLLRGKLSEIKKKIDQMENIYVLLRALMVSGRRTGLTWCRSCHVTAKTSGDWQRKEIISFFSTYNRFLSINCPFFQRTVLLRLFKHSFKPDAVSHRIPLCHFNV